MSLMHDLLPAVQKYVAALDRAQLQVKRGDRIAVSPLAQGEYNLNYLLDSPTVKLVLRVNVGTQINRQDQIRYEYRTLQLLQSSGVTPRPVLVDDSRRQLDHGILVMAFVPGEPLDYHRDREAAARVLARIHQIPVAPGANHLIHEEAPLTLITTECTRLLNAYFDSDLANADIRAYLRDVLQWARQCCRAEKFYQQDPWPAIINTEVNSGNFIVQPGRKRAWLVDWEMPRWGDPSQDLAHFCSPLTTLWKTSYRMNEADKKAFLANYRRHISDRHLKNTLFERIRLRDPFVYLRGIAWSAMAWAAYQTTFDGVKNPDTWATLQRYMDLDFIRSLFDPFIRGKVPSVPNP